MFRNKTLQLKAKNNAKANVNRTLAKVNYVVKITSLTTAFFMVAFTVKPGVFSSVFVLNMSTGTVFQKG